MIALSNRQKTMPASPIRKLVPYAEEAVKRGIKVYHLNIGQPDITTPPEFYQAIRDHTEKVLAYGHSLGLLALRQEIAAYYERLGLPVKAQDVMVTTGGSEAIIFALLAACDPGEDVIIPEPFYTNYLGFAEMASVKVRPIEMRLEDGFKIPPQEAFEKAVRKSTRAILYCSPNNPTGAIASAEEIAFLGRLAKKHNLFLLADEVYREFTYDGKTHTSLFSLPGLEDRTVILDSISKRFSACGARVGCLISRNPKVMDLALRFGQARLCSPTLEQVGAIAAYRVMDRYVPQMIQEYQKRRDLVVEALRKMPGVSCHKPQGAFYLVARLPVRDAEAFAKWLLTDFSADGHTVMFAPANGFYATPEKGMDEIRIAYVLKEEDLREAMRLLDLGLVAYKDVEKKAKKK